MTSASLVLLVAAIGVMLFSEFIDEKIPSMITRRTLKILLALAGVVLMFAFLNAR